MEFTRVVHHDAVVSVCRNGCEVSGGSTNDVGLVFLPEATIGLANGISEDDFTVVLAP